MKPCSNWRAQSCAKNTPAFLNWADKKQGATEMKVKELIELLQQCNPETEVYTFNDHEIHAITMVDEIEEWVHLNLGELQ
jgi:hypothetical protein